MKKNKLIVASLLMLTLLLVPTVNAALYDDLWFIETAVNGFKLQYPEYENADFDGIVTSGWHDHGDGQHKHVTLTAIYGYQDSGEITWSGRSYADERIYTLGYSVTEPEERPPEIKVTIHYVNGASCFYWDGKQWNYNEPVSVVVDGRTHLYYYPQY